MNKYEELAKAIERLENLIYGMRVLDTDVNAKAVQGNLIEIYNQLKEGYIKLTGENPWA
jgi:hypothetical protein